MTAIVQKTLSAVIFALTQTLQMTAESILACHAVTLPAPERISKSQKPLHTIFTIIGIERKETVFSRICLTFHARLLFRNHKGQFALGGDFSVHLRNRFAVADLAAPLRQFAKKRKHISRNDLSFKPAVFDPAEND